MNSHTLMKINNFVKNRLTELSGVLLILANFFLLASIISYSPSDPNFIYIGENAVIKNIGGFYGSVVSDFLLQSIGLISFLVIFTAIIWGFKLISEKKIINFISKIFYTLIYIIFGTTFINVSNNNSFWLIDNGNSGFVGEIIKENIYSITTLIENQYVVYTLIFLTIVFFILSLNLRTNEIYKILSSPILILKKIIVLLKRNKINENVINESNDIENKYIRENYAEEKQPILPFSKNKETKINIGTFKLPPIDFLENNLDIKNK